MSAADLAKQVKGEKKTLRDHLLKKKLGRSLESVDAMPPVDRALQHAFDSLANANAKGAGQVPTTSLAGYFSPCGDRDLLALLRWVVQASFIVSSMSRQIGVKIHSFIVGHNLHVGNHRQVHRVFVDRLQALQPLLADEEGEKNPCQPIPPKFRG